MTIQIDLKFLEELEGNSTRGYVPHGRKSGVTIGIGIDLGQQTIQKLYNTGLSYDTVELLKPYVGLRGEKALETLRAHPLSLPRKVADDISSRVITYDLKKLIGYFNEEAFVPFEELSSRQQTVVLSVVHQYGLRGAPKFLRYAVAGDWAAVAKELRNFGDKYTARRLKEVEYLEGGPDESIH